MPRLQIMDTTIRDGQQSLWATRMQIGDMLPILPKMDRVGYWAIEAWGGATFDTCMRFLDENPWERLRSIKAQTPNTPLAMLSRGQNLVGYKHYSRDICNHFIKAAKRNGVHVFRVFDALNDIRNVVDNAEAIKECGGHFEGAISYTMSPVHTLDSFLDYGQKLKDLGADSICIKDMAGMLTPYRTERMVKAFNAEIGLPLHIHCHYVGGMAPANILKAAEAGAAIADTAHAPLAFGNSHPAVEMIVAALQESRYDTGLDLDLLFEIAEYWEDIRKRGHYKRGVSSLTHMQVYSHQVPGGMMSNLVSQLEIQNAADRLPEVMREIPKVRAEVGYPPLVTPLSQIVGTQAVFNVLTGKRWSVVSKEMKDYICGYYGKAPGRMDKDIVAKVVGNSEMLPPDVAPGSLVTTTYAQVEEEIGDLAKSEEDVLMYALFPNEARTFLSKHRTSEKVDFLMEQESSHTKEDDYVDINQIRELVRVAEESGVGGRRRPRSCGRGFGSRCRRRGASERLVRRHGSHGGHVLYLPGTRRTAVRAGGGRGCRQPDAVHRRGHEAHERDRRRGDGHRPRGVPRGRHARRVRHGAVLHRAPRCPGSGSGDGIMFNKILIANRGEVALRIMRACKELGVKTVAVYSTEDADTYPVQYADEAVCIGPAQANKSYLIMANIIAAAKTTGAEAVHPGYGFLAENADFARACADNDLVFIGPAPECIERMGDKSSARETMKACGVPTVPGSDGCIETAAEAKAFADSVGYPVLIKATAGGGGKGMREVHDPADLEAQYQAARTEAGAAFGNDGVYLEKLVLRPRHVEIQVLADDFGNNVALCERDCSVQRRHQKLIEEAPSPALTEDLRRAMGVAAIKAVRAVNYKNAGTIEFLLDERGSFYFMEMNTRVQVEHPVTEQITGTDIIKEQLRIASGEPMSCASRAPFSPAGHAIEFRINAEDPQHGFRPCPGTITKFEAPAGPGVRVESYVRTGSRISPYYDSLVAKLVVYGQDREEALARGRRALDEFVIEGIETTIAFHRRVLDNAMFCSGDVTTDFIETQMGDVL